MMKVGPCVRCKSEVGNDGPIKNWTLSKEGWVCGICLPRPRIVPGGPCVYCVSAERRQRGPSGTCHFTEEPHCETCCESVCSPEWKASTSATP